MRKVVMLAAMTALVLTLAAGVATAKTFVCTTIPCTGTQQSDQIGERSGNDVQDIIRALGKGDTVNASRFGNDNDDVLGQGGNDRLNVADGDTRDNANCGAGNNDTAIIDIRETNSLSIDGVSGCENVLFPNSNASSQDLSGMSAEELAANTTPATDAQVAAAEAAYDGPRK